MKYKVYNNDCEKQLKRIPDNSIHSVVTDPPYGMSDHPDVVQMLHSWLNNEQYSHKSKGER